MPTIEVGLVANGKEGRVLDGPTPVTLGWSVVASHRVVMQTVEDLRLTVFENIV